MNENGEIGVARYEARGTTKRAVGPLHRAAAFEMQKLFFARDDAGSSTAMKYPATPAA
jgi:hypothetical protein